MRGQELDQELIDDSWIDAEAPPPKEPLDPEADRRRGLTILAIMAVGWLAAIVLVDVAWFVRILLLLLILIPMVLFHEWGHFWTARRSGIACKEFFVGFGPRLWCGGGPKL